MNDTPLGKVIHYYDNLGVAIVKLDSSLKVGDNIKFSHKDNSFNQVVESMQIEHQQISEGNKGQEVGIKVDHPVKDGWFVYSKIV